MCQLLQNAFLLVKDIETSVFIETMPIDEEKNAKECLLGAMCVNYITDDYAIDGRPGAV